MIALCRRRADSLALLVLCLLPSTEALPCPTPGVGEAERPQLGRLEAADPTKQELVSYLRSHWQTPEDYVVSKFSNHDIVFIGEYHRIKHDPQFIQSLIPKLYMAGIYNLGIEFGVHEDQEQVDGLINADSYDEKLARHIIFRFLPLWGYKEYIDIYRGAWVLNHSLPKSAPRFRVVNLSYRPNWAALTGERTPEVMNKVWHKGDPDKFMGQIILTEFVAKKQKALIYSGRHHAFTRYHQPRYNFQKNELYGFEKTRMGNVVYAQIGDRSFNIVLHSPWPSKHSFDDLRLPVGGTIDEVMREFKTQRVGFDVKDSPFGRLADADTYYAVGYDHFTLGTFTDGYVFQGPFSTYEGCTVEPLFITDENFQEAVEQLSSPEARKQATSPADLIRWIRDDADIRQVFRKIGK